LQPAHGFGVGVGVGVAVGVGVGVGGTPDSSCQKPPVAVNCPPLEVAPAAAWPIVPSTLKLPFELDPPPPAITLRERSNCALVCGAAGSAGVPPAASARSAFRAARSLRTGTSALPGKR